MIRYLTTPEHVFSLSSSHVETCLQEVIEKLFPRLAPELQTLLIDSVLSREKLRSTVTPGGVAFPRTEFEGIGSIICAAGISDTGITFSNGQYPPVQTFFLALYPKRLFKEYLSLLEHLVDFSRNPQKMALLRRVPVERDNFVVVRNEVLPWGTRDWLHSNLVAPFSGMLNRLESAARLRHG